MPVMPFALAEYKTGEMPAGVDVVALNEPTLGGAHRRSVYSAT